MWFDGDATMQTLDNQGLLLKWTPANLKNYTPLGSSLVAPDHAFFSTGIIAAGVIVYDTKKLSPAQAPKDWTDLRKPAFKNQVAENDPAFSGRAFPYISGQMLRQGGHGLTKGESFFQTLKADGLKIFRTNDPTLHSVETGAREIGIIQDSAYFAVAATGAPVGIVYPKSGVTVLPGVVAINARSKHRALALVHLDGLGARYRDQLSGGQQQRVAIARALATRPRLLLLDEPLSSLDAALREEMRVELARLLKAQGITAIYVTHDRTEALAMADHIIVLREGRIVQMGTPEELYSRPANAFIAGFLGAANFISGDTHPEPGGMMGVHRGKVHLRGLPYGQLNGKGTAVPRPEDGTLYANQPDGMANAIPGEVIYSEFLGGRWRHVIAVGEDYMVQAITAERAPAPYGGRLDCSQKRP